VPSGRIATSVVIQISNTRARYIHWTSCSNSQPLLLYSEFPRYQEQKRS